MNSRERRNFRLKNKNHHLLYSKQLLNLKTATDLCNLLKVDFSLLQDLINAPIYTRYSIPKKRSGRREIQAPEEHLRIVLKSLNRYLQFVYLSVRPINVHGFVLQLNDEISDSNIVENAKMHVGKKTVLTIDLKDFFPSITARRIRDLLLAKPFYFNENIANAIGLLTTYNGRLPQGAPTSPVLSNFVCLDFDAELQAWSVKNNIIYSRYADDLTFSADEFIIEQKIEEIKSMIVAHGFVVNEEKLRQRLKNRKQTVTGLTVNTKVNVDRRYFKKVRAMLHDLKQNGVEAAVSNHFKLSEKASKERVISFFQRLEGSIVFIGQVRGKDDFIFKRMLQDFYELKGINSKCIED